MNDCKCHRCKCQNETTIDMWGISVPVDGYPHPQTRTSKVNSEELIKRMVASSIDGTPPNATASSLRLDLLNDE